MVVTEDVLAEIAKSYTDYLLTCKAEGMQFIQPGRFVLPGWRIRRCTCIAIFPVIAFVRGAMAKAEKRGEIH